MLLRKVARPLLGTAFIASGVDAVRSPAGPAQVAEPLLESVPAESETVVRVAGAVQIGAGLALATGRAPRIASTVLVGTLIPTTLFASDFWNETDPSRKSVKQSAFAKNLGLLGGAMIAAADTEGKPSLGWRGRRRLEKAGAAIESALPGDSSDAGAKWHEVTGQASDAAHELAARVPVDDIRSTVAQVADATRSRAADVADAAPRVFDDVKQRAGTVVEEIADRAPAVAADARERAAQAGDEASVRARRLRRRLAN